MHGAQDLALQKPGARPGWPTAGLCAGALVLACVLALASVCIQRLGPEQLAYGNLCGPRHDQDCLEPALKGGFPLPYLTDLPGVSVEHQLYILEDTLNPQALVIDIAVYFVVLMAVLLGWRRRRGRAARANQ